MGLQTAAGADAHKRQRAVRGLLGPQLEVDVGQCVEFVHHNVDVVAADARRQHRHALLAIGARHRVELAAALLAFHLGEVARNRSHPPRVAHEYHLVGQLLRA